MQAQYNMGKIYRDGRGTNKDLKAAAQWFLKAARQGYAKAQNHIGRRLALGVGIAKDEVEALKWFILATDAGHEPAVGNRKVLEKKLTPEARAEAQRRARAFKPSRP
jgi:TPR repeat protein